jgi:hypothetical protein
MPGERLRVGGDGGGRPPGEFGGSCKPPAH